MTMTATGRVIGAALLIATFHVGRADEPTSANLPPSKEASGQERSETLIRPYLQAGLFAGTARDGGFAADLGLRVEKVVACFSYRLDIGDKGYLTYVGGRAGYILGENGWVALLAGAGAGGVTYHYDDAGDAKVAALTADIDLVFFPREWLGPVTLGVELLVPISRAPDPRNALFTPPALLFSLSVHPLVLAKILGG